MKKIQTLISASAIAAVTALPVFAQQATARMANETALEMAQRIDACEGSGVADADFVQEGTRLRVTCVDGVSGGLGTGGAIALGVGVVALIAIVASDSDSSSGT